MSNKILVTGGAGYIGSHMVLQLLEDDQNYQVYVLDDLSNGSIDNLSFIQKRGYTDRFELINGNFGDADLLKKLFLEHKFLAVMHFAAFIQVGESVTNPAKYYHNNFSNAITLLNEMGQAGIKNLIFSSTAAIFGNPDSKDVPLLSNAPKKPINPYGDSKLKVEQALPFFDMAFGIKSASLRYFNVSGVDPSMEIIPKERTEPTHLIPLVLQAASGRREDIKIFGVDYETPDGTCIRDYIHVYDLCSAHLLALQNLIKESKSFAINLGYGEGFSVREVIEKARVITGCDIKAIDTPRREGDPARLIASSEEARALGWEPKYAKLELILAHAWEAEKQKAGHDSAAEL